MGFLQYPHRNRHHDPDFQIQGESRKFSPYRFLLERRRNNNFSLTVMQQFGEQFVSHHLMPFLEEMLADAVKRVRDDEPDDDENKTDQSVRLKSGYLDK